MLYLVPCDLLESRLTGSVAELSPGEGQPELLLAVALGAGQVPAGECSAHVAAWPPRAEESPNLAPYSVPTATIPSLLQKP